MGEPPRCVFSEQNRLKENIEASVVFE